MNVLLISTYELGHQPFGLASPAKWIAQEGAAVRCLDLAVEDPSEEPILWADLVAVYLPMHTATRLAIPVANRVRASNPRAHLCFYGLYAPMNERLLRGLGAGTILGGEFEEGLSSLVRRLMADRGRAPSDVNHSGDLLPQVEPVVSLARQHFAVPDRTDLPLLEAYAHLIDQAGHRKRVGYTEATRGCKHLCRHCPIVPVYGGRFRVVQPDVVLADVENLVSAGAEHITFGDPDFFNGPRHGLDIVSAMHKRFPDLTYDVVIKVEHLVKEDKYLPCLKETGCILITCAVESFNERILNILDKRHSLADFQRALTRLRALGISLNPTFVAFTPWTTLRGYVEEFLVVLKRLHLVGSVSPVQYGIRLLIHEGSRLLELPETQEVLGPFDDAALCYRWSHPDPRMDELQGDINLYIQEALEAGKGRYEIFPDVARLALYATGHEGSHPLLEPVAATSDPPPPQLEEPWYCCAEPTEQQLSHAGWRV